MDKNIKDKFKKILSNKAFLSFVYLLIAAGIVFLIVVLSISAKEKIEKNTQQILQANATSTDAIVAPKSTPKTKNDSSINRVQYKTLDNLAPYYEINDQLVGWIKIDNTIINDQLVGWIKIDNTIINYPVVSSGDNEFYLTNNFEKEEAEEGAIFLDFRCNIYDLRATRNIILYGHRMKDGSMFKGLIKYSDSRFFLDNPIIQFDLLNKKHNWEIFTVFKTDVDFYYIDTYFPTDKKWAQFINTCYMKSMHSKYIELDETDIVLTLSTCTAKPNERFVVMAKLID
ncbi:MAG: class B sortase [Clostridiales bacterium]|nr:class B sortase [Clostridiales bacterium]